MDPVRVLMVADQLAVAEAVGFRLGVEPDMHVVGHVTPMAADEAVDRHRPDVGVVDAEADDEDGIPLISRLRSRQPRLEVVALLPEDDARTAYAAVRSGALGLVTKDSEVESLIGAVRAVARHQGCIPGGLLGGVLGRLRGEEPTIMPPDAGILELTPRERDVLSLMVTGLNRAGIAQRLNVSANTVRTHVQNLLRKLHVHSSLEAVSVALRAGWGREPSETGVGASPSAASRITD